MKNIKFLTSMLLVSGICFTGTFAVYADNVENTPDSVVFEESIVQESEKSESLELDKLLEENEKQTVQEEKKEEKKDSSVETKGSAIADKIESIARTKLGSPYVYGSTGPYSFDCSGFTSYVFRQVGIDLPRVASSQAYSGKAVSKANLQKGDLVFFNTMGGISHVGIYIGSGNFIHASSYGRGVVTSSLNDSYYAIRYVTAARYI